MSRWKLFVRRFLTVGVASLSVCACTRKSAPAAREPWNPDPVFWVWHRGSPLTDDERETLGQAGVKELYWQAAECGWKNGQWQIQRISQPIPQENTFQITPVFRIKPDPEFLRAKESVKALADRIQEWNGTGSFPQRIQLDFDCPDRVIGSYARFLTELGKVVAPAEISITALADWPRHPQFSLLAGAVASFSPMFYDLAADKPEDVRQKRFHPMAEESSRAKIRLWSKCPKPWLAGLPNFERLSLFDADGKLSGHIRGWEHDPVFFNPSLEAVPSREGITSFKVVSETTCAGTRIHPQQQLVHRMPDEKILNDLTKVAQDSGASGVIWFTLPGPGIQAAFSAAHLSDTALPSLSVEIHKKGSVILRNVGTRDLPARPCDPGDTGSRGWTLILESNRGNTFRSASPGGFPQLTIPGGASAEFTRTIHLHFSKLRAGKSITSGPLVEYPAAVIWSIPGVSEKNSAILK